MVLLEKWETELLLWERWKNKRLSGLNTNNTSAYLAGEFGLRVYV